MTRSPSHFKPDWLALREPADAAARSSRLTGLVVDRLETHTALHALDLGTGTGANFRYLVERLPPHQSWRLVDGDPVLLADVPTRMQSWAGSRGFEVARIGGGLVLSDERLIGRARIECLDLATALDAAEAEMFAGRGLVTASALLDLVSERWLQALARQCRHVGAAVLFALTYDGRIECSPGEPEDDTIRDLVNAHQQTDKGFGAALGATASSVAARTFAAEGYHAEREASDWVLESDQQELQRQLIDGWVGAALEIAPGEASAIRSWHARRLAHLAAGRSRVIVGHQDVVGWLPGRDAAG